MSFHYTTIAFCALTIKQESKLSKNHINIAQLERKLILREIKGFEKRTFRGLFVRFIGTRNKHKTKIKTITTINQLPIYHFNQLPLYHFNQLPLYHFNQLIIHHFNQLTMYHLNKITIHHLNQLTVHHQSTTIHHIHHTHPIKFFSIINRIFVKQKTKT